MDDSTNLADGLRRWAAGNDDSARAAVELLVEHDHWLWDEEFTARCIRDDGKGGAWIDWAEVRRYHDDGAPCSESQAAMLLVIADIGSCRWRIPVMDGRNRRRIAEAVARAAGVTGG